MQTFISGNCAFLTLFASFTSVEWRLQDGKMGGGKARSKSPAKDASSAYLICIQAFQNHPFHTVSKLSKWVQSCQVSLSEQDKSSNSLLWQIAKKVEHPTRKNNFEQVLKYHTTIMIFGLIQMIVHSQAEQLKVGSEMAEIDKWSRWRTLTMVVDIKSGKGNMASKWW